MSENGNPTTKDNKSAVPSTTLELHISWDQMTGQVGVTGSGMMNSVVFFGMMGAAADAYHNMIRKQNEQGLITIPAPNLRV